MPWLVVFGIWTFVILLIAVDAGRSMHLAAGWLRTTGPAFAAPIAFFIAAWGLGGGLSRRLRPQWGRLESTLLGVAIGWGVLQIAGEVLGLLGLFGRAPAWTVLAMGLGAAIVQTRRHPSFEAVACTAPEAFGWALAGAIAAPVAIFVGAPPTAPDEALYHLRFVDHLITAGGFITHPGDAEAGFAQGLHSMVAWPVALGGLSTVRPFAVLFAAAGLLVGSRIAHRLAGPLAVAFFAPIAVGAASIVRISPVLSTDVPLALFLGLATLTVLDILETRKLDVAEALLLGVLGGVALSVKYTTPLFFAPLYLVAGFAAVRGEVRTRALGRLMAATFLPVLFALPWLGRNAILYGHPLFPVTGMDLPPGDPGAWVFNFTANYGPGEGLRAWLAAPAELFLYGRELDRRLYLGRLNLWPLLAVPGYTLLARTPAGRAVLGVTVAGLMAWAGPLRRVPYLLPLWPLLAAMAAAGLALLVQKITLPRRGATTWGLMILLGVSGFVETASPRVDAADEAMVAVGMENRTSHLERVSDAETSHAWIRRNVPEDECVAQFFNPRVHGQERRTVFAGAEEMTPLRIALTRAGNADTMAETLRNWDCRWILRRHASWPKEQYPMLDEEQYREGFLEPLRIADEVQARHGILRFSDGPYRIYQLRDGSEHTPNATPARR